MVDTKQNLLRPDQLTGGVPTPRSADERATPPGYYAAIIIDALGVLAAGIFGYAYRRYLAGAGSPWVVVGVMIVFGIVVGLQGLLIEKSARRYWVILGEVAAMSVFFYDIDAIFLAAAALFSFIFFAAGYRNARRELTYSTEVRFFANTKGIIGKFVTAVLLFMVLLYVPQLTPQTAFVSPDTFSKFFTWSANTVGQWYPGIPFAGSFGDLSQKIIARELQGNPQYEQLPPESQAATVATNASSLIESFSQNLGVTIQASDTVSSVAYGFIVKTLTGWHDRFVSVFLIGWSVVVFLILRSIGIVFTWMVQLLLGVVYEILLAAGVIVTKEEETTKETIQFK
jgi:hypothetical protein